MGPCPALSVAMATRVNIFVNKILDDVFHPLFPSLLPTTSHPPTVSHNVDAMALNPDALNLNYDSDDSMQVDSDHEQINNHHSPVDNVQDPDADADGDIDDVDDTTSVPVAGPSSYTPKGSVSLTCYMCVVLV
jgi:hypothetical protein